MEFDSVKQKIDKALDEIKINRLINKDVQTEDFTNTLPPFYQAQAALLTRVRTWKTMFFVTTGILTVVIFSQQRIIFHKLFQKMNEEIVIVPGSPEFFRVRPGQIPSESVFNFSEYIAGNIGNFSYRNVKSHYGKISEFMNPITKGRFESDYEKRLGDWNERRVDQSFSYEPVKSFDLVNDERGPKYIVSVEGTRVQYVEGHSFSETRDILLLEFRPQGNLTPEKPFIFQIENLEWYTPSQFEVIKNARGLGKFKKEGTTS